MEWKADPIKLKWASKLSELLIVDVADALWCFFIENLPRDYDKQPDLDMLLSLNKEMFIRLRDTQKVINHEMYSILYPEDDNGFNPANFEIDLLYTLIRHLCIIKSPSWKLWFENPTPNQTAPIFNIIRMIRFKEKMNDICNDYRITEEIYNKSWDYLTNLLNKLNHNSTVNKDWNYDIDTTRTIVDIMRWQSKSLEERDLVYLNLWKSRNLVIEERSPDVLPFSTFISQFGQKRGSFSPEINRPLDLDLRLCVTDYNISADEKSVRLIVNQNYVHDPLAFNKDMEDVQSKFLTKKKYGKRSGESNISSDDLMYKSIDHEIYIEEKEMLQKCLCEHYIQKNSFVIPLPLKPSLKFHINTTNPNLSILEPDFFDKEIEYVKPECEVISVENLPGFKRGSTVLKSWRDALITKGSLRIIVTGEHSIGKTTFLEKLSYEWATENMSCLHQYMFVFYVDLELVREDKPYTSLSDCIIDQCDLIKQHNIKPDEIEELFKNNNGENILLLFDNIDQMPLAGSDAMSEISDVICGKKWEKVAVVMTTTCQFLDQKLAFTEKLYRNITYLVKRSLIPWTMYSLDGFKTKNVLMYAQGYFETFVLKNRDSAFREFKNYLRLFQRDVYVAVARLPIVTSLLCEIWMDAYLNSSLQGNNDFSYCECVHEQFKKIQLDFGVLNKDFLLKVLGRVFSGKFCRVFTLNSNTDFIELLIKKGILHETKFLSHSGETCVRFSNSLFEQFTASCVLTHQFGCHSINIGDVIQKQLSCVPVVLHLQHFILFCCYLNKQLGEEIIQRLSQLMKFEVESGRDAVLRESVANLCIQCFYEMKLVSDSAPFIFNHQNNSPKKLILPEIQCSFDGSPRFNGGRISLSSLDFLSSQSKQALLSLTTKCTPSLSSSGTVFPFLKVKSFWFKAIAFSSFQGKHMEYISKLLKNLPFLELASFTDVYDVTDVHVSQLCSGLLSMGHNNKPPTLHHLEFTTRNTYDQNLNITSYAGFTDCVKELPYLDTLKLTMKSASLLFSLFKNSFVIPLTKLDMPTCGFSSFDCQELASVLHNLIFVETIDLSCNMLLGGFEDIAKNLTSLRHLKEINVSDSCLTTEGIALLSTAFQHECLHHNIRHFDVSKNEIQDEKVTRNLCCTLSTMKNLEYLNLSCNLLGDVAVCLLANGFRGHRNIQKLFLDSVQIGPRSLSCLSYNLVECSNLNQLSLAGNYFGKNLLHFTELEPSEGKHRICRNSGLKGVTTLDLSGVSDLSPVFVSSKSVLSFIQSITSYSSIRCLFLRHVDMKSRDLVLLLNACENHKSLRRLVMSRNLNSFSSNQAQNWKVLKLV